MERNYRNEWMHTTWTMDKRTDNEVFGFLTIYIIKRTLNPMNIGISICFIVRYAISNFTNFHPIIIIVQVAILFLIY